MALPALFLGASSTLHAGQTQTDVHVLNDLNSPVFPKIRLVNRSVFSGIGYLYAEYQTDTGGHGFPRIRTLFLETFLPRTMGTNRMAYGSGGEIRLVDVAWTEWHADAHTLLATSKTGSFSENGPDR
ncbi:uncharacterized protein ARMOST_07563 [Armillaria ostoyae]|uniref:Uncharacterized protein n=1 Tax=Armillaria ostoyae TaxID=47428 RepID=A0A284R690_ARMOS|nr:uncharacterized protein ARMOST_07563 [Armillaria ostoyae]